MQITRKKLSELKPLEKNVRNHSDIQIKEFERSLKQFGQTRAFVIDEQGNILVGNGMYIAMQNIGAKECDCFVMTGLSEIEKKKLVISDNKVFELGQNDYTVTEEFLKEIVSAGDKDVAGFQPDILESIVNLTQFSEQKQSEYGRVTTDMFKVIEPVIDTQVTTQETTQEIKQEYQPMTQAEEHKYIICPHCNERIEL